MTEFIMGLPPGSRDLLPPASRRRRELTRRLIQVFERWGYAQTMTPLLEYYDVLARGLSPEDRRQCVRFIDPRGGAVVALRSDFTPQIARMAALRLAAVDGPRTLRVSYADELVRLPEGDRDAAEQHQAGVELVGDGDPAADAELIALAHDALVECGLSGFRIDLSHRHVVRTILERLAMPAEVRVDVEALLARKDRGGIVALLKGRGIQRARAEAVGSLCSLYGDPSVLERAQAELAPIDDGGALERLRLVLAQLSQVAPRAFACVDVDLGEVRGFEYYSGLRVRVWAPGVPRPLVRGGRYDDLVGRYGTPAPATGFAIDLDTLEAALRESEIEAVEPEATHLVAVGSPVTASARTRAGKLAAQVRSEGIRSWVESPIGWEQAQRHARRIGAQTLTYFDDAGAVRRVRWSEERWISVDSQDIP